MMNKNLYISINSTENKKIDFRNAVNGLAELRAAQKTDCWYFTVSEMFGKQVFLPVLSTADTADLCIKDMDEYTLSYISQLYGKDFPTDHQLSELCGYCVEAIKSKIFKASATQSNGNDTNFEESISHYSTLLFMILMGRNQPEILVNSNLKAVMLDVEINVLE
ncbi:hypothetical protein ACPV44_06815 [Photobacterium damselae]